MMPGNVREESSRKSLERGDVMGYWEFIFWYAGPFIGLGLIYLLWVWSAYTLENRFPKYYKFCQKANDYLPKIVGFIILVLFLFFYFTSPPNDFYD
jgi:hypothetical protein